MCEGRYCVHKIWQTKPQRLQVEELLHKIKYPN